ncbi:MAG: sulfurtransferase TusA family protein [Oscillospiraceae bacterium]|nr:sulfurtransferase TusA family protein [Oscillospiraceae bacterium]
MLDARGLSCPMPVVMVQKAVKSGSPDTLEVLLDAECSVENVTRYARNQGYTVTAEKDGEDTKLTLKK